MNQKDNFATQEADCQLKIDASHPAVELHGVRKTFAGRAVLDGVDLAIGRGEVFALVGPSGSGKSTLLKMISGIDSPDEGSVWLAGKDVTTRPPYRRAVHTVFQNYALFPHLNVAANVAFPLRVAGRERSESDSKVATALGWVGLGSMGNRRVTTLSGGERQRVALARALVDEPECVLLDEPLSALDPHLRAQTLELLQDIQRRLGVTYLYVTHDREEALRAAHRVGVLNHGRLEQIGAPEEIYRRPQTPFVASFIGPINWFEGVYRVEDGRPGIQTSAGAWLPTEASSAAALEKLRPGGAARLGVRPESIRLGEEGFVAASVVSRQFSGAQVAVRVTTREGDAVAVEISSHQSPPAIGEIVYLSWTPSSAHLFAVEREVTNSPSPLAQG